jgi:hypothetical protein
MWAHGGLDGYVYAAEDPMEICRSVLELSIGYPGADAGRETSACPCARKPIEYIYRRVDTNYVEAT